MIASLTQYINKYQGSLCCRTQVGQFGELAIGFGDRIYHRKRSLVQEFYGKMEIGTYFSDWRVLRNREIIVSRNSSKDRGLTNDILSSLIGCRFVNIVTPSIYSATLLIDDDIIIEFSRRDGISDHLLHIFVEENYFEFDSNGIWVHEKNLAGIRP
jgi:hypothetical protein